MSLPDISVALRVLGWPHKDRHKGKGLLVVVTSTALLFHCLLHGTFPGSTLRITQHFTLKSSECTSKLKFAVTPTTQLNPQDQFLLFLALINSIATHHSEESVGYSCST